MNKPEQINRTTTQLPGPTRRRTDMIFMARQLSTSRQLVFNVCVCVCVCAPVLTNTCNQPFHVLGDRPCTWCYVIYQIDNLTLGLRRVSQVSSMTVNHLQTYAFNGSVMLKMLHLFVLSFWFSNCSEKAFCVFVDFVSKSMTFLWKVYNCRTVPLIHFFIHIFVYLCVDQRETQTCVWKLWFLSNLLVAVEIMFCK